MNLAELEAFLRFAASRIEDAPRDWTIDDLAWEWDSFRRRDKINAAIREGLADVDAGRT